MSNEKKKTCFTCSHFDNRAMEQKHQTLGFCKRFIEVVPSTDLECISFIPSKEKENHFRNLEKQKKLDLIFKKSQYELFDGNLN